jgi:hypothetical protein
MLMLYTVHGGTPFWIEMMNLRSSRQRKSLTAVLLLLMMMMLELLWSASGFVSRSPSVSFRSAKLAAVTEEQVLAAVEQAEGLWAEALEARKKANEAAEKAEAARASNESNHQISHLDPNIVRLANFEGTSMEQAQIFLEDAVKYSDEADKIEAKAEVALAQTEKLLEVHLKDFPDSSLAQDE